MVRIKHSASSQPLTSAGILLLSDGTWSCGSIAGTGRQDSSGLVVQLSKTGVGSVSLKFFHSLPQKDFAFL
jgi:hypothetical protein